MSDKHEETIGCRPTIDLLVGWIDVTDLLRDGGVGDHPGHVNIWPIDAVLGGGN